MVRAQDCIRNLADKSVQALLPQHVAEGSTQTLPAWTPDNVTQVPNVSTSDEATSMPHVDTVEKETAMAPKNTTTSWTQVLRVHQKEVGTEMQPAFKKETQAGLLL